MQCVSKNSKTYKSLDLTTICPNLEQGNPCPYCYVQSARKTDFRAKQMADRLPYRGEILHLQPQTIKRLNRVGGLRLFSFGDYKPWMDNDLFKIIHDAARVGLKLKAITKQIAFVEKFAPYLHIVNISVDNIGYGVPHITARRLREKFSNVLIRCTVLQDEDLRVLAFSDIFTFNHARNGFKFYPKELRQKFNKLLRGRVCGATGTCKDCLLKCGENLIAGRQTTMAA